MDDVRRYEVYVVFQPDLEDDQLETRLDRVTGYLTGIGGEIVEIARRGKRRLAYPINKFTQGIDVIYQANVPGVRLETLERQLNLNEDVIRYLVVRRDDLDKLARQQAQTSAAASTPQPTAPVAETPAPEPAAQPIAPDETAAVTAPQPIVAEASTPEPSETQMGVAEETDATEATPATEASAPAETETSVGESEARVINYIDYSAAGTVSSADEAEGTPVGTSDDEIPASGPTSAVASDVPETREE